MPTVSVPCSLLTEKFGRQHTDDEFGELCFQFGLELDEIILGNGTPATDRNMEEFGDNLDNKVYRVEVPANRYDLLCAEGLIRGLRIFTNEIKVPKYVISQPLSICQMFVKPATQVVRPFVVASILRHITLDKSSFRSFIEIQEKLHQTVCRKRTLVAIGTHDLDTLKPPFVYDARHPDEISFIPLNKSRAYTAAELMVLYSKDSHLKPYLSIIQDKPCYPVITDSDGTVLSMPPIINGEHSRVTMNTRNILIEATATDLNRAIIVLDTLVTIFSEYCTPNFNVEPVEVVQHDGSRHLFPRLEYRDMVISVDYVNRLLGTKLSESDVVGTLGRMGLASNPIRSQSKPKGRRSKGHRSHASGLLSVRIPPTRHDILHACDIAEDVAIAYGYDRIPEQLPTAYCIAYRQPVNQLSDLIRAEIAQAGFTEALSFSLCSRDDVSTNLRRDLATVPAVHVANPKTHDFQVVRPTLLPGILRTLSHNRSLPLPLKLFEVQDVVIKDSEKDVGASNHRRVCAVYYNKNSGFEIVHGLLDHLMRSLSVRWKPAPVPTGSHDGSSSELTYELRPADDPTYFTGRCADIVLGPQDIVIGRLGVLHPDVLRNFDLTMPCSVLDFDLEVFL